MTNVEIVPYRDSWPAEFDKIAAELRDVIGHLVVAVDHIGSTAVPALPAKDLIDVMITVTDDAALRAVCDKLADAGHPVERESLDHPVATSPDPQDWVKAFARERPGQRRTHIHIRIYGRANHRYALVVRDYLRGHPLLAAAYAETKRRLAEVVSDGDTYAHTKDPVSDLIYLAALDWAESSGWRLD